MHFKEFSERNAKHSDASKPLLELLDSLIVKSLELYGKYQRLEKPDLRKSLADIYTYFDLFCQKNGVNIEEALMHGYHVTHIPKGEYGKYSKVVEEIAEAVDAWGQQNKVMFIHELSDVVGAIEGFAASLGMDMMTFTQKNGWNRTRHPEWLYDFKRAPTIPEESQIYYCNLVLHQIDRFIRQYNLTMMDLTVMSAATRRAFVKGERKS